MNDQQNTTIDKISRRAACAEISQKLTELTHNARILYQYLNIDIDLTMFMPPKKSSHYRFKAKVFNALSDPMRLEILEYLREGEKCVCEIVPYLGLIQPVVSRHLKILKDCGLVKDRKDGTRRLYSITEPKIFEIIEAAKPELLDSLSKRAIEQVAC